MIGSFKNKKFDICFNIEIRTAFVAVSSLEYFLLVYMSVHSKQCFVFVFLFFFPPQGVFRRKKK